jgi:hypothetical protein
MASDFLVWPTEAAAKIELEVEEMWYTVMITESAHLDAPKK